MGPGATVPGAGGQLSGGSRLRVEGLERVPWLPRRETMQTAALPETASPLFSRSRERTRGVLKQDPQCGRPPVRSVNFPLTSRYPRTFREAVGLSSSSRTRGESLDTCGL